MKRGFYRLLGKFKASATNKNGGINRRLQFNVEFSIFKA